MILQYHNSIFIRNLIIVLTIIVALIGMRSYAQSHLLHGSDSETNSGSDSETIAAGRYTLDPSHTSIIFRIKHLGLSYFAGRFNIIEATLMLDPMDLSKTQLDARIDIRSIDTNSTHLEDSVQKPGYFDTNTYRFASFVSTAIEQTGPHTAHVTGNLTMKGVTHPVTLDVMLSGFVSRHPFRGVPSLGFFATTTIMRSDWEITQGLPLIGDEVDLEIAAEFWKVE